MERRAAVRVDMDRPASLTVLDDSDAAAIPGRIVNASGAGLGLDLEAPVAPGAAARVDCGESLFLGEVKYCRAQGAGFQAGVRVDHAIYGLASLARELMEEQPAARLSRAATP